jgi:hypothetical protein
VWWRGGGGEEGEWLERLTAHANIATGLSSISAFQTQWNLNVYDVVFNELHKFRSNRPVTKKVKWNPRLVLKSASC